MEKKKFQQSLSHLYGVDSKNFQKDFEYLWDAFCHTEDLWSKNMQQISKVKYILIAEAPLYGEKRSYIYNHQSSGATFLGISTVRKILGLLDQQITINNKPEMLSNMREMGVKDAWIVAYENNARKDIKEVLENGGTGREE